MNTGAHCEGCGRTADHCATGGRCTGTYEPPRFCVMCGRRLRVLVTPAGWKASCRDHGSVGQGSAPSTA